MSDKELIQTEDDNCTSHVIIPSGNCTYFFLICVAEKRVGICNIDREDLTTIIDHG